MSSRRNGLALAVFGALGLMSGCVDNDQSLVNVGWVAPDVSAGTTMGCVYPAGTPTFVNRGIYDATLAKTLGSTVAYRAALDVLNNLPAITGEPIDTQRITVRSFDVQLISHGEVAAIIPSTEYNYMAPSNSLAPGESASMQVQAFAGDKTQALFDLQTQAKGNPQSFTLRARPVYTRAEEEHTGAYADLPIDICWGCLSGGTAAGKYPDCTSLAGATPLNGNACNAAADLSITCCNDSVHGTGLVCGQAVTTASMAM